MKAFVQSVATAALCALGVSTAGAAENVVASIRPVASLVAGVMQGAGEPALIVDAGASPHTYSLKPSNARALQDADLVFWVGPDLEAFLEKPLASLGGNARIVTLSKADGVTLLPSRKGGAFEKHMHHEAGADHDHENEADGEHRDEHAMEGDDHHDEDESTDWHIWLDPENARAMIAAIEKALAEADPRNAALYARNAKALNARLDALESEVAAELKPVSDKPFIVFHDAYQYFEHRFGVHAAGSITVSPETIPGAARVAEIRKKVSESGAACVFAEPQFQPKLVDVVIEGTNARAGVLDPLGSDLAGGPDLYFALIRAMATSLKTCLAGNS